MQFQLTLIQEDIFMNDTTDFTTLTMRLAIFLVIAGIFYFVLKSKKKDEE